MKNDFFFSKITPRCEKCLLGLGLGLGLGGKSLARVRARVRVRGKVPG